MLKSVYNLLVKQYQTVLSRCRVKNLLATTATFILASAGLVYTSSTIHAAPIVTDGATKTKLSTVGNQTDITTKTIKGKNAFNSFSEFNVHKGHTVNLHIPNAASNLVNVVRNKATRIDGILNGYKNGKIAGNVFFLNPHGIIISNTGVVNVGSLSLVTPTKSFVDSLISKSGNISQSFVDKTLSGRNIPLSDNGLIIVNGQINALKSININSANITTGSTSLLRTGYEVKVAFKSLVNVSDLETGNDLVANKDGSISIVSAEKAQISGKLNSQTLSGAGGDISISAPTIIVGAGANLIAKAVTPNKDGKISLTAEHSEISKIKFLLNNVKSQATIDVAKNSLISGGQISIIAKTQTGAESLFDKALNSLTKDQLTALNLISEKTTDLLNILKRNYTTPISFSSHQATSKISLAGTIKASDSVSIDSSAKVNSQAISNTACLGLINVSGEANSSVIIKNSAKISANKNVNISSNALNNVTGELKSQGGINKVPLDIAVLIAHNKSTVLTDIQSGAKIVAGNSANIHSSSTRSTKTSVEVSSSNKALGAAIGLNLNDSSVKTQIAGSITAGSIVADATTTVEENFVNVKTQLGKKDHTPSKISKYTQKVKDLIPSILPESDSPVKPRKTLGIAGAVSINKDNAETKTIIHNNAKLNSLSGNIEINTKLDSYYKNSAIAQQFKDPPEQGSNDASGNAKKVAAAIGLSLTSLKNNTATIITTRAKLNSADSIKINTTTILPFKRSGDLYTLNFFKKFGLATAVDAYKELTGANYGIAGGFFNSWSQSASKAEKVGIAGSITLLNANNNNTTIIDGNASLVAKNKVSLDSKTTVQLANLAGQFGQISLSPNNPFSSDKKLAGVGASYLGINLKNNTKAIIASGSVKASNLLVNSKTDGFNIAISAAGGSSESIGFNGSVANIAYKNSTISQIDDSANVKITGKLKINSADELNFVTAAGALTSSGSIGIGASVLVHDISRDTRSVIGNLVDKNGALQDGQTKASTKGNIQIGEDLSLASSTKGVVVGLSAAGTNANGKEPSSSDELGLRTLFDETNDKIGVGVSGSVNYNKIDSNTQSYIDGNTEVAGITLSDKSIDYTKNIDLTANNQTDIFTLSGAVAVARSTSSKPTAGIAGAYSHNSLSGRTETFVRGIKSLSATDKISLAATRTGKIFSISAGLGGAFSQKGAAVTGSASYSNINNSTRSFLDDTNITKAGATRSDVTLGSTDTTKIRTIAGSASYGSKAGFGSSIAISNINANTNTFALNSNITSKNLSLLSTNRSYILSVAGTAGVANDGFGFGGIVSVNNISNSTKSSILSSDKTKKVTIDLAGNLKVESNDVATKTSDFELEHNPSTPDKIIKDGKVNANKTETKVATIDTVSKKSDLKILSISAGLAGATKGSALAAAVSVNNIKNNSLAEIHNANITSSAGKEHSVSANSGGQILSIGLSASGSSSLAGAGNVSINRIGSITKSSVKNSSLNLKTGSLGIIAAENSRFFALGSALSGSGVAAGSAVVTYNQIKSELLTEISNSTITLPAGALSTKAWSRGSITSLAIGGTGAGKAALAGTASFNVIGNFSSSISDDVNTRRKNLGKLHANSQFILPDSRTIASKVYNSQISSKGISSIESVDESNIFSLAIAAAGSGVGSGSLAGSYNHIGSDVETIIHNSKINANQIAVSSVQASDILNINVGGAGAGGIAAAVSIGVNKVDSRTQVNVENSSKLTSSGTTSINALQKSDILGIAGAISGAGKVAAGASIIDQRVETSVTSKIESSAIKSKDDSILVHSKTAGDIQSYAAAGAGSGAFSAAGSSAFNKVTASTETTIDSSKIESASRIALLARNKTAVKSLAGGAAISGGVGASGSICSSVINNTTKVSIADSSSRTKINSWGNNLNSAQTLGFLTASASDGINYLTDYQNDINFVAGKNLGVIIGATEDISVANKSISLSASGIAAVTGVVSSAKISGTTSTNLTGADINDKSNRTLTGKTHKESDVDIIADYKSNINMLTGGGAFSGYAGIGASTSIVRSDHTTATLVDNSKIFSENKAKISSNESSSLEALTVSGAGGFVGVNGSSSSTNLESNTLTTIKNSTLSAKNLAVLSDKTLNINFLGIRGEGGALSLGLTANLLKITGTNSIDISGNSKLDAKNKIEIKSSATKNIDTTLASSSAAGISLAGVINKADFNDSSYVTIKDSVKINSDDSQKGSRELEILAKNNTQVTPKIGAVQFAGAAAGSIVNLTDFSSTALVDISGSASLNADKKLSVNALNERIFAGKMLSAAAAVGFTLNGSVNIVSSGGLASDSEFAKVAEGISKAGKFIYISKFFSSNTTSDSAKDEKTRLANAINQAKPSRSAKIAGYVSSGIKTGNDAKVSLSAPDGKIIFDAKTNTNYSVNSTSVSASGLVALGGISDYVSLNDNTVTRLGGNIKSAGTLNIDANSTAIINTNLIAGSSGSLADTAASAQNNSNLKSNAQFENNSKILSVGKLTVNSKNHATTNLNVDTVNVSAIGASGARIESNINTTANINIGSADIRASKADLLTENVIIKPDSGDNINAGAGGLANGSAAVSLTNINANSNVNINRGANISIGSFANRIGGLNIFAKNRIDAHDSVDLDSGGAISLASAKSIIHANSVTSNITVAEKASVKAAGNLVLGTQNNIKIKTHESTDTWGGAGSGAGSSSSKANSNASIIIKSGALVESWRDLYLGAGSIEGAKGSVSLDAQTRVYNKTAIPIKTDPNASSVYNENHSISVEQDAKVRSVSDIYVAADKAKSDVKAFYRGTDLYRKILSKLVGWIPGVSTDALESKGGHKKTNSATSLSLNGILKSGIHHWKFLHIDKNGKVTYRDPDNPELDLDYADVKIDYNMPANTVDLYKSVKDTIDNLRKLAKQFASDKNAAEAYNAQANYLSAISNKYVGKKAKIIEVKPVTAVSGNIYLTGDKLNSDGGTLKAPGDVTIKIVNESDRFLKIVNEGIQPGLYIPEKAGGQILYNGVAVHNNNDINKISNSSAKFSNIKDATTEKPKIIIRNTFAGSSGKLPTEMLVENSIYNLNGLIDLSSTGSIYIGKYVQPKDSKKGKFDPVRILGQSIKISTSGDFVQGYRPGFNPAGGGAAHAAEDVKNTEKTEENKISAKLIDENGNATSASKNGAFSKVVKSLKVKTNNNSGIIAGGCIFISAQKLNVTGLIQSGIAKRNIVLDANQKANYKDGSSITPTWQQLINKSEATGKTVILNKIIDPTKDVQIIYTPEKGAGTNGKIVIQNIQIQGGFMELVGDILSTGHGELRALDGYGSINLKSNMKYDTHINGLNTGSGVEGIIRITDQSASKKVNGQSVTYQYSRLNGILKVHKFTRDKNGNLLAPTLIKTVSGNTTTFNPTENRRYTWINQKVTDINETHKHKVVENGIPFINWKGERIIVGWREESNKTYTSATLKAYPKKVGGLYFTTDTTAKNDTYMLRYWRTIKTHKTVKVGPKSKYYHSGWQRVTNTWHYYKRTVTETFEHSLKADCPIKISFIGNENQGTLNVNAPKSNLFINGLVQNKAGNSTIIAKGIYQGSNQGLISIDKLSLHAGKAASKVGLINNIGQTDNPLQIENAFGAKDKVITTTANGSIYIQNKSGALLLGDTTAAQDISIDANSDLQTKDTATIIGNNVTIKSRSGSISSQKNNPVNISVSGELNAEAGKDIKLSQKTGDLKINTVKSHAGDVEITLDQGNFIDANQEATIDPLSDAEQLSFWKDAGLLKDSKSGKNKLKLSRAIKSFENSKTANYHQAWNDFHQRKNAGDCSNPNDYNFEYSKNQITQLKAQGLTDKQIVEKQASKNALFKAIISAGNFDKSYKYVATENDIKSITAGSKWTIEELKFTQATPKKILELDAGQRKNTTGWIENANIIARNINLNAKNGSIGIHSNHGISNLKKLKADVLALYKKGFTENSLTAEEHKTLDAFKRYKIALAGLEQGDLQSLNEDGFTYKLCDDINFKASGKITASATGNIYLGSGNSAKVEKISAGENLRFKTSSNITSATEASQISAKNIILESSQGEIGNKDNLLNLRLTGANKLVVRAPEGAFIACETNSGSVFIGEIFAKTLKLLGPSFTDNSSTRASLAGGNIDIKTTANGVGTAKNPLSIIQTSAGLININSNNLINILTKSGSLNLGDLISKNKGSIFIKNIANRNAQSDDDNQNGNIILSGDIKSEDKLEVSTKSGDISMKPNSSITTNGEISLSSGGNIHTTQITTNNISGFLGNSITIDALRNVYLGGTINAINSKGLILILSNKGSVESTTKSLNINAPEANLIAITSKGIGNKSAIRTNINTFYGANAESGNINLVNTGNLNIGLISIHSGNISIYTTGNLTADNITTEYNDTTNQLSNLYLRAGGDITLEGEKYSAWNNFTAFANGNLNTSNSNEAVTSIIAKKISLIAKTGQIGNKKSRFTIDSNGLIDAYAAKNIFYTESKGDAKFDRAYTAGRFDAEVNLGNKISVNSVVASKLTLNADSAKLTNLDSMGIFEINAPLGYAGKTYYKSTDKLEKLPRLTLDSISVTMPRKGALLTIESMKVNGKLSFAVDNLNANIHHVDQANKPLLINTTGRSDGFANNININIDSPNSVLFETIKTKTGRIIGKVKNNLAVENGNILNWLEINNNLVKSRIDAVDKSPRNGIFHLWTFDGKFTLLMNNQGVTTNLHALNYQANFLLNQNFSTENSLRRLINKETIARLTFDSNSLINTINEAGDTVSITVPDFGARLAVISIPGLGNMDVGYFLALSQANNNTIDNDRELSLLDFNN